MCLGAQDISVQVRRKIAMKNKILTVKLLAVILLCAGLAQILPALPAKATTLTADQVTQAAYGVGFSGGALVNAIAINAQAAYLTEPVKIRVLRTATEHTEDTEK